jgi:hypothetical protein
MTKPGIVVFARVGETLSTLDRQDFVDLIGGEFYGLQVRLPYEFLEQERAAGRLLVVR